MARPVALLLIGSSTLAHPLPLLDPISTTVRIRSAFAATEPAAPCWFYNLTTSRCFCRRPPLADTPGGTFLPQNYVSTTWSSATHTLTGRATTCRTNVGVLFDILFKAALLSYSCFHNYCPPINSLYGRKSESESHSLLRTPLHRRLRIP